MEKLIFVYNADSGKMNAYLDMMHKVVSPGTYPCSLCDITHGVFKEREKWKRFRENSDVSMEFLHKDEFQKKYASKFGHKFEFPVVLFEEKNLLSLFISKVELAKMDDEDELISLIEDRINQF